MHVLSRGCSLVAVLFGIGPLSGCGLYLHNDAYQRQTDAAADAVAAATFAPRIEEIGKEAVKASSEYEASIIAREVAFRDRRVVAIVKQPLLFAGSEAVTEDKAWFGMPLLKQSVKERLQEIAGTTEVDAFAKQGVNLRTTYKAHSDIGGLTSDYESNVKMYLDDPSKDHTVDLSCGNLQKLGAEDLERDPLLGAISENCDNIANAERELAVILVGDPKLADAETWCAQHQPASSQIAQVYCDRSESRKAAEAAKTQVKSINAQIDELQKRYKAKKASGEDGDEADKSFLDQVKVVQDLLASTNVSAAARAAGLDRIANILKDALAADLVAVGNEGKAAAGAPAAVAAEASGEEGEKDKEKIELAASAIRVVSAGITFGRAYEEQPPFDRANTAIIALAHLRYQAGAAEIERQKELAKERILLARQEALIEETTLLSMSWQLAGNLSDTDIVSMPAAEAAKADAALSAYVASVNRGYIPARVLIVRQDELEMKQAHAISLLAAQKLDQVTKAAAEGLRAYGKGGIDPEVAIGGILGALAVAGIWF